VLTRRTALVSTASPRGLEWALDAESGGTRRAASGSGYCLMVVRRRLRLAGAHPIAVTPMTSAVMNDMVNDMVDASAIHSSDMTGRVSTELSETIDDIARRVYRSNASKPPIVPERYAGRDTWLHVPSVCESAGETP